MLHSCRVRSIATFSPCKNNLWDIDAREKSSSDDKPLNLGGPFKDVKDLRVAEPLVEKLLAL